MRRARCLQALCAFSLLSLGDAVTAIQATAYDQASLLKSLRSPDVTTIIVTGARENLSRGGPPTQNSISDGVASGAGDITFDAASWTLQDSVLLTDGRKVLLTSGGDCGTWACLAGEEPGLALEYIFPWLAPTALFFCLHTPSAPCWAVGPPWIYMDD